MNKSIDRSIPVIPGIALLILPIIALIQRQLDWSWVTVYLLLINVSTYFAYALDKRRARKGAWRIAETWLHLFEFLGGWPAALVAQRHLRHKCAKQNYQILFWLIILVHQLVALDAVLGWRLLGFVIG